MSDMNHKINFFYFNLLTFLLINFNLSVGAQTLSFKAQTEASPIEVYANNGIEWQREKKVFIARGAARAIQGEVTVFADELIAYYRETSSQETDVYRIDALGNVTIKSLNEIARGSAAVYDFELDVLVIEGSPSKLETSDGIVTSNDTIQFWGKEDIAVAKGNAFAERGNNKLLADTLVARFDNQNSSKPEALDNTSKISVIEGFGNVKLETNNGEIIMGDRGKYDLVSEIAVVDGNVKIRSENNQMRGGFAVVDTVKGISTLYPTLKESGYSASFAKPRVSALLVPKPKKVKQLISSD